MKRFSIILFVFTLCIYTSLYAQNGKKEVGVEWHFKHAFPEHLKAGDEMTLVFTANLDEGTHIYAANQPTKKAAKPLMIYLNTRAKGVELVGKVIDGPEAISVYDDIFKVDVVWFDSTATISQKIRITEENPVIALTLDYQLCGEDFCIPFTGDFIITNKNKPE